MGRWDHSGSAARRGMGLLPLLIVTLGVIGICWEPLLAQKPPKRIRIKKKEYKEPQPDMSLPVGTPNPPFIGEAPVDAPVVNRTGTYGGTLVDSETDEIDTFNPVDPKGAASQEARTLLFSRLVSYRNAAWEFEPELASSWTVSEDYKTWEFQVRSGVLWSDGKPLTIEDVKFSFDAVFHPEIPNSMKDGFRDEQGRLPSYEILPGNRIRFQTEIVDSQFLTHIGNVAIIPKHKWGAHLQEKNPTLLQQMTNDMDPKDMVGTGPFVLKQYVPAEKIVFERNPRYWKVDARGQRLPYLDRLVIAIIKDQNLQWQKFEAGEHDIIEDIAADRYKEAKLLSGRKDEYELVRLGTHVNTYWMAFNLHPGKNPDTNESYVSEAVQHWFHKLEFRHAVNHAIDRTGLVKSAMQGRGKPIWASFSPGNKAWHHPGVPKYEYDPARANELLDGLGWTQRNRDGIRLDDQGRPIKFTINTNVDNVVRQQIGTLIQSYLREVGIGIHFKPLAFNDLITSLQDSHKWECIILGWGAGVPPDPANGKNITTSKGRLHVWYPQQPSPATEWEAEIDSLMGKMDQEIDNNVRKKYNDRIQEIIAENSPILYLVSPNAYAMAKKRVGNLWPSVLRPQLTWNIQELFIRSPQ